MPELTHGNFDPTPYLRRIEEAVSRALGSTLRYRSNHVPEMNLSIFAGYMLAASIPPIELEPEEVFIARMKDQLTPEELLNSRALAYGTDTFTAEEREIFERGIAKYEAGFDAAREEELSADEIAAVKEMENDDLYGTGHPFTPQEEQAVSAELGFPVYGATLIGDIIRQLHAREHASSAA